MFVINSDHKPLRHIFDESKPIPSLASARLQRWALTVSVYDYTIEYKPGAQNGNADLFSRLPLPEAPTEPHARWDVVLLLLETWECSPITATQIQAWTARDTVLSRVAEWLLSGWSNTDETFIPLPTVKRQALPGRWLCNVEKLCSSAGGGSSEGIAGTTHGLSRNV